MHKTTIQLPPLNWLKTFVVAAQLLNFTSAAKDLNMTQSAVSQQIKLLESHLGQALFHRQHKKLTLTNTGMAYLPTVLQALEAIQRSTQDLFTPLKYGILTIQVNTAFLLLWLTPRIADFMCLYPDITLRIMSINWNTDRLAMSNDLIIDHGRGAWRNREVHRLLTPKLRPFCSPEIKQKLHNGMDLGDFSLIDIIGNQQQWGDWLKETGLVIPSRSIRHQVDTMATAAQLARLGVGMFLSYDELLEDDIRNGALIAPFDRYIDTVDSYYLTHDNDKPLSKTAELFKNWLLSLLGGQDVLAQALESKNSD
jgi:LysR family glycine cleavage system transcriptional activator